MLLLALALFTQNDKPVELFTATCGVRVLRQGAEYVEELYAVDVSGKRRLVLVSPTHKSVAGATPGLKTNLLQGTESGLFQRPPTFAFEHVRRDGNTIVLGTRADQWTVEKRVTVPRTGTEFGISLRAATEGPYPQLRYLLCSYAFAPDGMKMGAYGKPDSTWAPGLRPGDQNVIGDHQFRAPAVVAQKGSLAATLMPDLDVLSNNRPVPTIIDLDCKSGVVDAPLLSYGFSDYKLSGHVYFSSDASMVQPVPWDLQLGMKVLVDAKAEPMAAYRRAPAILWKRYGSRYFDKILPQAMPFADYARVCYPAAFAEKATGGWFEHEINGVMCGGLPSGWGLYEGWVSWQDWFNQLRSAWGLRWWGKKLGEKDWIDKADKMLNLALAAPMDQGAVPTTYLSRTKSWKGTLISPSPDCYYDLTNMAWKGLWMLKWLEFEDCPRREEIEKQLRAMADLMLRFQNKDGSFPTWLSKDLKVVPILDRSAQSALPTWFLAKYSIHYANRLGVQLTELRRAVDQGATAQQVMPAIEKLESGVTFFKTSVGDVDLAAAFLAEQVAPSQRYYDFETFFSCSPKQCLQRNGLIDDLKMWDLHTMQAPQNTLCMQWAAEALNLVQSAQFGDMRDRVAKLESSLPTGGKIAKPALAPRSNGSPRLKEALMALDIMALYQNVWPISYRKVAYTYGGFGVQNSDGEYNDARQAQFGSTLCDFGAQLGRQDYFQRGVAAIRASLTLINHPRHIELELYPNPNYPLGLQPENNGHGGTDQQNGRTGFDWGEGSGLASAAEVMDKYGSTYRHAKGWSVSIDGKRPWVESRGTSVTSEGSRFDLAFHGEGADELSVSFRDSKGRVVPGDERALAEQSGVFVRGSYSAPISETWPQGAVSADVTLKGVRWTEGPFYAFLNPTFDFTNWRMPGWTISGDFLNWPARSTRYNFNAGGKPFIGTCEDGKGGFDDKFTGTLTSPKFVVTKPTIKLLVGGGAGPGVYVELLDRDGKRLAIEHGRNTETMDERTWNISVHKGQTLQIRIVDSEKGGWGHINVGNIRMM